MSAIKLASKRRNLLIILPFPPPLKKPSVYPFYFPAAPTKPHIQVLKKLLESYTRKPVTVSIGATVKVLTNTMVTFVCNASGIPGPSYSWNNGKLETSGQTLDRKDGISSLTMRGVNVSDEGTYVCVATNKAGVDSGIVSLVVVGEYHVWR